MVDVDARLRVAEGAGDRQLNVNDLKEVFTGGQCLADQAGAGGVLTFTFASPVDLALVRSVGGLSRCDPFGDVPTSVRGIRCADDEPTYIPVRAVALKVWAPQGAVVTVAGFR